MGVLEYHFDKDNVQGVYLNLVGEFPNDSVILVDDLAEIYRGYMADESPFVIGDMREGLVIENIGMYGRYVFSDVPYFDAVVAGHWVYGPIFTEKQLKWWFWYLRVMLGGEYVNKTDGFKEGNDFPSRAYEKAQPRIDDRIQQFLTNIGSGS